MIYLICGFPGAGKTEFCKKITHCKVVDLDHFIENETGKTIQELIQNLGEDEFRNLELDFLRGHFLSDNTVVSLGGGSLSDSLIKEIEGSSNLTCFWLATDFETCWKRIEHDKSRPITAGMSKAQANHLYNERSKKYSLFEKIVFTN